MGYKYLLNIKDITIPLIIHYYLLRAFRTHYTNLSAKSNVRFLPYIRFWGVGMCNTCTR